MDNLEEEIKNLRERIGKMEGWMITAEKQIIRPEAKNYELMANFSAVLTCVRIFGKIDQKDLQKTFAALAKDYHQKLLEKLEDQSPLLGAMMDQRNPDKE